MCPRTPRDLLDNKTFEEESENGTLDLGGDSQEDDDEDD